MQSLAYYAIFSPIMKKLFLKYTVLVSFANSVFLTKSLYYTIFPSYLITKSPNYKK